MTRMPSESSLQRERTCIRAEREVDQAAVHAINAAAFGSPAEAGLVDALRAQASPTVSLVADIEGEIAGHIMLSPVCLEGHPEVAIMGLAPMAVAPAHQRAGIGSALVRAGLDACREQGFGAVVVLGHPDFYPRFGFSKAATHGIRCEFDVPEDAFMLIELEPDHLRGASGTIRYHDAFKAL